jgi:hypothetical protein
MIDECQCCGFKTELNEYPSGNQQVKWLCHLCSETLAGNTVNDALSYGRSFYYLSRCIIYCTHVILKELKAMRSDMPTKSFYGGGPG